MDSRSLRIGTATAVLAALAARAAVAAYAPGYGPGIITAVVRDASGHPMPGVIVDASGPTQRSAATSAAGIVTFSGVPAGHYVVRARTPSESSSLQSLVVTTAPGSTAASRAFQFVALQLEPDSLGASPATASVTLSPLDASDVAPAFSLAEGVPIDVTGTGPGSGVRIAGGDLRGARELFDGVPLPDGLRGSLALFGAPALATGFAATGGTGVLGGRPAPGTGGVLALATQPLGLSSGVWAAAGSSDRGLATWLAVDQQAGAFAAGFRAGAQAGGVRDRVIDARARLSSTTEIDGEAFRFDDTGGLGATETAIVRSATLATALGDARVALRAYDSRFLFGAPGGGAADDGVHGVALHYDGTLGPSGLDVSYVRDVEFARYGNGTSAGSTEQRLGVHSSYELSPAVRADVQYAYGRGDLIGDRSDVATAIGFALAPAWKLKFAASSGVSPAPLDLVAARAFATVRDPETAFEDSVSLAHENGARTFDITAFETRTRDRFAALSDARATGVSADFAVAPAAGFGFDLSGALAHVETFGVATPARDPGTTILAQSLGLAGTGDSIAALRGRAGLSYRGRSGFDATLGATYSDAPNALAPSALVLADLSLGVPLTRGAAPLSLRLRARDLIGGALNPLVASEPAIAPSQSRRTVELTLERPASR